MYDITDYVIAIESAAVDLNKIEQTLKVGFGPVAFWFLFNTNKIFKFTICKYCSSLKVRALCKGQRALCLQFVLKLKDWLSLSAPKWDVNAGILVNWISSDCFVWQVYNLFVHWVYYKCTVLVQFETFNFMFSS